jgi:hypothetical protein
VDLFNQFIRDTFVTRNPEGLTMTTAPRTLAAIARDIRTHWKKPYFGAVPYLEAMGTLGGLDDKYFDDDARSIARYFLANAGTWRGDDARRIKGELKAMLGDK